MSGKNTFDQSVRKVFRNAEPIGKRSRVATSNAVTVTASRSDRVARGTIKGKKARNEERDTGVTVGKEPRTVLNGSVGDTMVLNAVSKLSEQIALMVKRMDDLESRRESNTTAVESVRDSQDLGGEVAGVTRSEPGTSGKSVYIVKPTVDRPLFSGRDDVNPMRFIKKLKGYISSINAGDREVQVITQCLTGSALKVLEVYSDEWTCFEEFERDFLKIYWNHSKQETIKYQLVHRTWDPTKTLTMSEHFSQEWGKIEGLTIPCSEIELVNTIIRHFPPGIQQLWFSTMRREISRLEAIEFLRGLEQNVFITQKQHKPYNEPGVRNHDNVGRGRQWRRAENVSTPVSAAIRGRIDYRSTRGYRGQTRGRGFSNRGRFMHNARSALSAIEWKRPSFDTGSSPTTTAVVKETNVVTPTSGN